MTDQACDEAVLATVLASTFVGIVTGRVHCNVDCFKARLKQEGYEIRCAGPPEGAVEDDLLTWLQSLPKEAAPELRKAYEFYKQHKAGDGRE